MKTVQELMRLDGRVALVTGGAGHLGGAICEALAEIGASVMVSDQEAEACEAAVEGFRDAGLSNVACISADLRDEQSTRDLVRRVLGEKGRLDILVHCAAFVGTTSFPGWVEPLEKQTVTAWDAALRVNLTSAFVLAQEAAPALSASGHGSVVLVSSIYGMVGPDLSLYEGTSMQNPAAYGASKGGLLQLVRHLATALAPKVRVNALTPGGVWRNQPAAFREKYEKRTPLARMAVEEDLKGAAAFLASDLSAYVTGHNLVVDGGWTVW